MGVNFDTGNSFLAGNDPVEYLRGVAGRVVHVHVKDIPAAQLPDRGKITGTRVGVAVGDGVVDLAGIVGVLAAVRYRGFYRSNAIRWNRLANQPAPPAAAMRRTRTMIVARASGSAMARRLDQADCPGRQRRRQEEPVRLSFSPVNAYLPLRAANAGSGGAPW